MSAEPTPAESAELDRKIFDMGYRPTAERIKAVYGEGYEAVK